MIAISSSRTRLAGSGTSEPVASRIATSRCMGTPVRALSSSNVSSVNEANRLYAGSSMKSNERSPLRSALARASSGMRCRHHAVDDAHAPDVAVGEPAIGVGLEDPQLDEVTQLLDA